MRKLVLLMHVSLDGYVAGTNGEMDWVHVGEDIFELAYERTQAADAALYGRITYEMMDNYWPGAGEEPGASLHDRQHSEWYNRVQKVVVSRTLKSSSVKTTVIDGHITREIRALKEMDGKDILLLGSPSVVHKLVKEKLIDDFYLMVNPILLGDGIPLFKHTADKTVLNFIKSTHYSGGVVGMHYQLK